MLCLGSIAAVIEYCIYRLLVQQTLTMLSIIFVKRCFDTNNLYGAELHLVWCT